MIAWWGWVLIWTGLVIALLAMVGALAWWLFRKFLRLLDDVADLAERSAILEAADAELVRPQIAVLSTVSAVRAREDARRFHRRERRRVRRQTRLDRARRITGADAAAGPWPADWYDKR
ncbi:hypothetical protein [Schumannella luteola]